MNLQDRKTKQFWWEQHENHYVFKNITKNFKKTRINLWKIFLITKLKKESDEEKDNKNESLNI